MITGEQYEHRDGNIFYEEFLGYILIILANILLLNLIVAIMGDSYEEIMTSVAEKNLKQQNLMILKAEAVSFGKEEDL